VTFKTVMTKKRSKHFGRHVAPPQKKILYMPIANVNLKFI